jgi:hypothetical protein
VVYGQPLKLGSSIRGLVFTSLQIDLLYLHNVMEVQLPAVGREELMRRLRAAFETLEGARSMAA